MSTAIYTVIVGDHSASLDMLCRDLQNYPDVKIVETTNATEKARKVILQKQPDLVFIDVEMSGQTGLELLKDLVPCTYSGMCIVAYITSEKYIPNALRASTFDYLLKPYKMEELNCIIEKVRKRFNSGQKNMLNNHHQMGRERKFAIHTVTGLLLLNRMEVLYFKYLNTLRSWQVAHTNFSVHKLQLSTTSKDILEMSSSFVQVSRDYIVNIEYLYVIENKTLRCALYPPFQHVEIYASRRYFTQIKEKLSIL